MTDWKKLNFAACGGDWYERRVRDGTVVVKRLKGCKRWQVWHNGRFVRDDFSTARQAMENVDEAEMYG